MLNYQKQTDLNLKKYAAAPQFIDYRTQPQSFKLYPKFFRRYKIEAYPKIECLKYLGMTTLQKKYGKVQVDLRANPSAGGLYPCEVYIQLRGIEGLLNGIYHYEQHTNSLTLIHELSNDGVEFYFEDKRQYELTFLISNVYFRSSWKYDKRAIRYLLLDSGHQIGSIYAALKLQDRDLSIDFDFDVQALNDAFGFSSNEQFCIALRSTLYKEISTKALREAIVSVSAVDYYQRNTFIESFYKEMMHQKPKSFQLPNFLCDLNSQDLKTAILKRRSTRAFHQQKMTSKEYTKIFEHISDFAITWGLDLYYLVHEVEGKRQGLYKAKNLVKPGDFRVKSSFLALNQSLAGQACVTVVFTANQKQSLSVSYLLCAFLAHIIYLRAAKLELGCSALGAYFDEETQEFLQSQNSILYYLCVGR